MPDYTAELKSLYSSFGPKKRIIADFVLNQPMTVLENNIAEFAVLCGCNQTTIVRFAQQLHFSGYSELKIAVARHCNIFWKGFSHSTSQPGDADSSFRHNYRKLASLHSTSVMETLSRIDEEQWRRFMDRLAGASSIMLAGTGYSFLPARDLHLKLTRLGVRCHCYPDSELWKTFLGYLDEKDVLIAISNSGTTSSVTDIARLARKKKIAVAAITSGARSPLARTSDFCFLTYPQEEIQIRLGAMTSRTAQFMITDLIALEYSLVNPEHSRKQLEKAYV